MSVRIFSPLRGELSVPGDKSISHRAVMLGSLAKGTTEIRGFLSGADCLSTISCFRALGVRILQEKDHVTVSGRGLRGLRKPEAVLDCGNSGTTMRLISGILAAQPFGTVLTGDASIQKRPMDRIITPLSMMGAEIRSIPGNGCAPLSINGQQLSGRNASLAGNSGSLRGISYESPVASAQVKSAVLLAGLFAEGKTSVTEPFLSRDHTERMLRAFGAEVHSGTAPDSRPSATVFPAEELSASAISIPGDISSAAFFLCGALMVPGSDLVLRNVGINPTRSGILDVVAAMGGSVEILSGNHADDAEPAADLHIRASRLHGTEIGGSLIPRLIDELPVIAAIACAAKGTTVIRDARELKIKESDRIRAMAEGLSRMGAAVTETPDGLIIEGGRPLKGAEIDSRGDHRVAMAFSILSLIADGPVTISHPECVSVSAPDFYRDLKNITS